MPYSREAAQEMLEALQALREQADSLTDDLFGMVTRVEASRTYMMHGLLRRVTTLLHCIERVFETLPPEEPVPTREAQQDATIYLQTFVVNVAGVLDNLARIWCLEVDLRERDGRPIRNGHIGLGPDHITVRNSLPNEIVAFLNARANWFDYLKNYRDALAHRIPLYIPPWLLRPEDEPAFQRLEQQKHEAHEARGFGRWHALLREQMNLGRFEPLMAHSLALDELDGEPMRFHAQILADLRTLLDIGSLMQRELVRRQGLV
jgi:hypothetical protein